VIARVRVDGIGYKRQETDEAWWPPVVVLQERAAAIERVVAPAIARRHVERDRKRAADMKRHGPGA